MKTNLREVTGALCGLALWGCGGASTFEATSPGGAEERDVANARALGAATPARPATTLSPRAPQRPVAWTYGNLGTWGALGVNAQSGGLYRRAEDVLAKYDALCEKLRDTTGFGEDMDCHADLIGYTPAGYVRTTQQIAEGVFARGGSVTINLRPRTADTRRTTRRVIEEIFSGQSILTEDFLRTHPVGISIDPETFFVAGRGAVPAEEINEYVRTWKEQMLAWGHAEADLPRAAVYDFGYVSTLVADPENLDDNIDVVVMSITYGANALDRKQRSIEGLTDEYRRAARVGCMMFTEPHLIDRQRDNFTLEQGINAFGHLCDIFALQ